MNPVVRGIISGGERYTAADVFEAEYRLMDLRRAAAKQWTTMDLLVVPTTGTIYAHDQVASDPVKLNTNLGYYTNFVNLMDLAAVAAPAGFRSNGLPFGISFIAPAFSDEALLALAHRYLGAKTPLLDKAPGCVDLRRGWRPSHRPASEFAIDPARRAAEKDLPHSTRLPALCAGGHQAAQTRLGAR